MNMFVKRPALGDGLIGQLRWQGQSDLKGLANMQHIHELFILGKSVFQFSIFCKLGTVPVADHHGFGR